MKLTHSILRPLMAMSLTCVTVTQQREERSKAMSFWQLSRILSNATSALQSIVVKYGCSGYEIVDVNSLVSIT